MATAAAQRAPGYTSRSNAPPDGVTNTRPRRLPRYMMAGQTGQVSMAVSRPVSPPRTADDLDEASRENIRLSPAPAENPMTLALRLALLLLMTVCCYGVQVLLERQRRARVCQARL